MTLLVKARVTLRLPLFGALAQLVERFHGMEEARGSNPLSSTAATSGNDTQTPPSRRGFLFSSTQAEHTEPLEDLDAVPPSAPPASGRTSSKSPPSFAWRGCRDLHLWHAQYCGMRADDTRRMKLNPLVACPSAISQEVAPDLH